MPESSGSRLALVVCAEGGPPEDDLVKDIEAALAAGAISLSPVVVRPPPAGILAACAKRHLNHQRKAECP